jgi:hypothetical protein
MLENTQQNKERFFAQYYGQKVWRCELHNELMNVDYEVLCHVDESIMGAPIVKEWLELTALENISDEDAQKLPHKEYDNNKVFYKSAKDFLNNISIFGFLTSDEADKLREMGYLIEFNSTPTQTLLDYNWVKLRENR